MSNPFYYLAGLLILSAYPWGHEPLMFVRTPVAPWALLGALALYGALCGAVLSRPLAHRGLAALGLRLVALLFFGVLVFIFHIPLWVAEAGVEDDPLASTLLSMAPLLALYSVLAVVRARTEPHGGGLRFAFRSFLGLSFLPIFLMLLLEELFTRVEALRRIAFLYPSSGWLLAIAGLSILMIFLPPLLRIILGARPMPPGPLRERLERMCSAAGFEGARLLVVPTGSSRMANAFVAGLSTRWRYVFFTGAILDGMTPEELECVLVHEITHAKKRHISFYLIAALAFSLLAALVQEAVDAAGLPAPVVLPIMLAWIGLYWGAGFGYVSRRFETEADLVAARVVPPVEGAFLPYGAARRMAAALRRVADLNHMPHSTWSWRHFTIQRRIDILLAAEIDPAIGASFERVCGRFRVLAVVLLFAGLLSGGVLLGLQQSKVEGNRKLLRAWEDVDSGHQALAEKRYEPALAALQRGVDGGADIGAVWVWMAECERALGREKEAVESENVARRKGVTDPRLRVKLER